MVNRSNKAIENRGRASSIKDFELSLRLRNNHLKSRRKKLGLTQRQMAQLIGVGSLAYGRLESLRVSPRSRRRGQDTLEWKPSARKIAEFFGCGEAELWPDPVLAVTVPEIITEVGADQLLPPEAMAALLPAPTKSPEDAVQSSQAADAVHEALNLLPEAHAQVLRLRFGLGNDDGPMELAEVGRAMPKANGQPKSRERVRQIEAKALRHLRHPSYAKKLRHFAAELPGAMPERTAAPINYRDRLINEALSGLTDSISSWADRNQRPAIYDRYLRHYQELQTALCYTNGLRGARVQVAKNLSASASVLKTTRNTEDVMRWVLEALPEIEARVKELLRRTVFFVMIDDEQGSVLFSFWMEWDGVEN